MAKGLALENYRQLLALTEEIEALGLDAEPSANQDLLPALLERRALAFASLENFDPASLVEGAAIGAIKDTARGAMTAAELQEMQTLIERILASERRCQAQAPGKLETIKAELRAIRKGKKLKKAYGVVRGQGTGF